MAGRSADRRSTRRSTRVRTVPQRPWSQPRLPYAPIEILSADQIEAIHRTALTVLQEVGMRILEPKARGLLAAAGASVDEDDLRVRFDPAMVEEWVARAPAEFTLSVRNPAHNLHVGGRHTFFAAVGGPAFCSDLDRGRRAGTYAEMCDYLKLIQSLNILHQEGGGPFEALDLPAGTRHLDLYYAQNTLMDKNWQPQGLGRERVLDALEMAAIALGTTREGLLATPVFTCIINTNSPLLLDIPMAEGLVTLAEHGQAVVLTPFTLAGAMAPITLAGALAQQHAEILAGIALCQIVRPGAPVMYGGFTSNVDMKSGSPAFGTPEYTQAAQASGQLARRIGVPFRSSNVTAANAVDAQAAYESAMSLWGALLGGAHLLNQAAGWLEGGLTASFEKLIVDAEMLQMMAAYFAPMEISEASLALDAVREVGPGGHYFGTAHTLERYESAFYVPLVSNWDNYETWLAAGGITASQRANGIWKRMLAEYEPPPLDPATDEALREYVARRKRELAMHPIGA
ncbi:MAG: trimethylamine methyltransferase family protein [Myxococcales bacterium]|nr:trimethylamine methyltransferase family protein [Myxococcales bacterium]MDH5306495.1 trimethylamine methyltransferase family protein [Myxococcales bacterium]MDH5567840.1 trimethylamine methyltransferase family protein [Myxococcales bacterium]